MASISLEDAQAQLAILIEQLAPDEELVLTRDDKPIATLKALPQPSRQAPRLGTLKGTVLTIAPEFDDIPEGFEEYLS